MKLRCSHKICVWLACMLLVAAMLPVTAFARERVDVNRMDCTLSIEYPCSDVQFRLYRVADISAAGKFTLVGDFVRYSVSFVDLDSTGWKNAAATLDGYIRRDDLPPADTQATDSTGKLTFSGLQTGLYLVTWDRHTTGGYTYTPQPILVSLPGLDADGNWTYEVSSEPKFDKDKVPDNPPDEPDTVDRKVLKIWKDGGSEERPSSVTVQLLWDGRVYDEVTLSAANNWKHEWTNLDADHTWQVVEKDVPEGYTVSVGREGITFTVTNTLTPPPPPDHPDEPDNPPDNPDVPDNPPDDPDVPDNPPDNPDTPDNPDEPDKPDNPDNPDEPDEPDIPQTGQLWWPVPLLACGGVGLFLVGWLRRRNGDCGGADE